MGCRALLAQQPAYFILGEDQFKGIKIYDIIQDRHLNYWIATNEGLFYFDHYTYQRVDCPEAKSNSVFNFIENKQGVIFCHNLNNQIFKIENKNCTLFYELQREDVTPDLSLALAPDGGLLVGGKRVIHLSPQGKTLAEAPVNYYLGPPYTDTDGSVYYQLGGSDSVLKVVGPKVQFRRLKLNGITWGNENVYRFFDFQNKQYSMSLRTKTFFSFDPQRLLLTPLQMPFSLERGSFTYLYVAAEKIWVAGTLPGVLHFSTGFSQVKPELFYPDYIISDVYQDREGNVLLGTFDNGILVIPDLEVPDVIRSFKEDPVTALQADSTCGLLMGTSKGRLLMYRDKQVITICDTGKRFIEAVFTDHKAPVLVFDNGTMQAYFKHTKQLVNLGGASLKDAAFVSSNLFYLGTNRGIVTCRIQEGGRIKTELIKDFNFRIYALVYSSGYLYASTSNGFYAIDSLGKFEQLTNRAKPIYPTALCAHKGRVFAADKKEGILVINAKTVVGAIPLAYPSLPEVFSKIRVSDSTLFARSYRGLFQFNLKGQLLNVLSAAQGLSGSRVIDFALDGNSLWVSHTNGVQNINFKKIQPKSERPLLFLTGILVNDSLQYKEPLVLPSSQHKIQFSLNSPSLRNREGIRYHYKLEGLDAHWSVNGVSFNQIAYNALSPGSYVFLAKAEKQGVFSDTISFPFSIAAPFYTKTWFILLAIGIFLLAIVTVYKWQLNRQRKRAERINELNASKLTAIQSQMNPHFIFNSLNSIQNLILKGDVEHSYSYISTFSDLVRRTLSYSDKDFIDFEQELKLIEIYLSLEKLRFKKDFTYEIDTGSVADIQIPPMLIQPFIENALAHGLLHKKGGKQLKIIFRLGDVLECCIEDNGVGRERAKAIKERQGSAHESFSVSAIRKRFEILSEVLNGRFGFRYEDLVSPTNEARGTRVIVEIPVKHKY